jgi:hypothetical protein
MTNICVTIKILARPTLVPLTSHLSRLQYLKELSGMEIDRKIACVTLSLIIPIWPVTVVCTGSVTSIDRLVRFWIVFAAISRSFFSTMAPRSNLRQFFKKTATDGFCNRCKTEVQTTGGNTAALRSHLRFNHTNDVYLILLELKKGSITEPEIH